MGGANIQIVHYFDHGYLKEEKSMIHSFTVTFGAKYLTGMVTSVPPYETFSLIKNNILHQSEIYKNHFENSIFWGFRSHWSCDIQFHKYAVHINGDFWWALPTNVVGRHYRKCRFKCFDERYWSGTQIIFISILVNLVFDRF